MGLTPNITGTCTINNTHITTAVVGCLILGGYSLPNNEKKHPNCTKFQIETTVNQEIFIKNIFVWVAGIRKLNAQKFFSNEYLRQLFFYSYRLREGTRTSSEPSLGSVFSPQVTKQSILHKKSEQSFFTRVKV